MIKLVLVLVLMDFKSMIITVWPCYKRQTEEVMECSLNQIPQQENSMIVQALSQKCFAISDRLLSSPGF